MKHKLLILTCFIFLFITLRSVAATVDTALTHSNAMKRDLKAVVIKPDSYTTTQKYPTLYLLHGYSGSYSNWILKVPGLKTLSDQYQVIIVCPDGGYSSWYFDSAVDKTSQYETYVATELVAYIDKNYATITNRAGRAITGLSMGGHGGLYLGIKHQAVFGACGSMSGGVDIRAFAGQYGIDKLLGKYSEAPEQWEQNAVINMLHLIKPNDLAITFDCGYDDFMYRTNINLHEKMLDRKIPHDFTIRPGGHTWEYWANSIKFQMVFFNNFFTRAVAK